MQIRIIKMFVYQSKSRGCILILIPALCSLSLLGCNYHTTRDQNSGGLSSLQFLQLRQTAMERIQAGDYRTAKEVLEQVVAEDESDAVAQNALGICAMKIGEYPLSAWAFGKAITFSPDSFEAINNLGMLYEMTGKLDQAVEQYQQAYQQSDSDIQILGNMTRAQLKLGLRNAVVFEHLHTIEMNHPLDSWRVWARQEQVKAMSDDDRSLLP